MLLAALASVSAASARSPQETDGGRTERIDLRAYGAIRDEGLNRSRVMEMAGQLMDGIGPRITASPNLDRAVAWARDTLLAMGIRQARLEDWGEFGTAWSQSTVWARMTVPDVEPLSLQAAPWSAPTPGPVQASVAWIDPRMPQAELDKLKGTLRGKIVLLGPIEPMPAPTTPLSHRLSDDDLARLARIGDDDGPSHSLRSTKTAALKMLRSEGVAAIIEPSRPMESGGGTGLIVDDNFSDIGAEPWNAAKRSPIPHAVMIPEHFGRLARLAGRGIPVAMELDIDTKTDGDHHHGINVVAEIPGTDRKLALQVVMAGAHLDSWPAGTGATDDGAGVVVGMEAMRILAAVGVRPRRTIRLALWTGEEQGLYGSRGYVRDHLATFAPSDKPAPANLPAWLAPHGATLPKPDWKNFDVYFNLDDGAGRVRGIYTNGDLETAAIFRAWIAPLADLGVTTVSARLGDGSDEEAFQKADLPAFAFIQDPLDYETRAHHSNLDTLERLDESDLKQAAVVEAIFLLNAAQRDASLPRPLPRIKAATTRSK